MEEKVQEKGKAEASQPVKATDTVAPEQTAMANGGGNRLSWVALVTSLSVLLVGGYGWYQNTESLRRQNDTFLQQLSVLSQNRDAQSEANRVQMQNLEAQSDSLSRDVAVLSTSIDGIAVAFGEGVDVNQSLQQIEKLMVFANRQLNFLQAPQLAEQALEFADDYLKILADPVFVPIRALLTAERTALHNTVIEDRSKILRGLATLAQGVDELPLRSEALPSPDRDTTTADSPPWGWAGRLLTRLGARINVNANDHLPSSFVGEQHWLEVEKIKLILETCQLALIRGQSDIYQARMAEARTWVDGYFDLESPGGEAWLQQFEPLINFNLQSALPDISASLREFRKIIVNRTSNQ